MAAHGTDRQYSKHKCRCRVCVQANTRRGHSYAKAVTLRPDLRGMYRDEPDPIAVERIALGDRVRTGVNDRREVATILTHRRESARNIARRLGVSVRTVMRYRAEARRVA